MGMIPEVVLGSRDPQSDDVDSIFSVTLQIITERLSNACQCYDVTMLMGQCLNALNPSRGLMPLESRFLRVVFATRDRRHLLLDRWPALKMHTTAVVLSWHASNTFANKFGLYTASVSHKSADTQHVRWQLSKHAPPQTTATG